MDDIDNLPNCLFISLRHEFKATRVIDRRLSPTTIKLKLDFSEAGDDTEEDAVRKDIALRKIQWFVDNVLNGSLILDVQNEWAMSAFLDGDVVNTVVQCPNDVTDVTLAEVLMSKFAALSMGCFALHSLEVESTDGRNMSFLLVGSDPSENLPEGEEWLTPRNFFSKPWWGRSDASSRDTIPDEEDDLSQPPSWAHGFDFITDGYAGHPATQNVVRPEFRPTVIDGGKSDQ